MPTQVCVGHSIGKWLARCQTCLLSYEQNLKLTSNFSAPISNPLRFRRLVGQLLYLTITRPDITYSLHLLSQFMQDPRQGHWEAAVLLLRYLKSCSGHGIFFLHKIPSLSPFTVILIGLVAHHLRIYHRLFS